MTQTQGIVRSVRIDQEGRSSVLRFVVESSNDRIPVEMRGNKVKGVLEAGNEVVIKGRGRRDRDGVIRPREIMNKTTNSLVSVRRKNLLVRFVGFSFSVAVSVVSGVISAIIAGRFAKRTMPVRLSRTRCSFLAGEFATHCYRCCGGPAGFLLRLP